MEYQEIWQSTKGIPSGVTYQEGELLYRLAHEIHLNPCGSVVEIGAYLGKSTIIMASTGPVISIDHHRGNREHQIGQSRCRPGTVINGRVDTFPLYKENLERAGVWQNVIPVTTDHLTALSIMDSSYFPVALLFVDAEHSYETTTSIISTWRNRVKGTVLFHDCNEHFPEISRAVLDASWGAPDFMVDSIWGYKIEP